MKLITCPMKIIKGMRNKNCCLHLTKIKKNTDFLSYEEFPERGFFRILKWGL